MATRIRKKCCELLIVIGHGKDDPCVDALSVLLPQLTTVRCITLNGERYASFSVTQELASALETLFPMYFAQQPAVRSSKMPRRALRKAS